MIFATMSFMAQFLAACDNIFVKGVVLAIAMDTFLGCLRAAKYHKWNSSVGIDGGIRKAGMLVSVLFLVMVDMLLHFNALSLCGKDMQMVLAQGGITNLGVAEFFCIVYIMYEATSILKNMLLCDLPVPAGLKDKLAHWLAEMTEETKVDIVAVVEEENKKRGAT